MRQVAGFGDRSTARGTFGANLGRAIVTIVRHTCATVSQPSELRFAVGRAVGRGIVVLHGGPRRPRGKGGLGVFVPHFHNGKCNSVADGEMFPIRMRKLDNISVRQMCRWKARFVGFLAIYSLSRSNLGFMRN